jgi:hypothetical protein
MIHLSNQTLIDRLVCFSSFRLLPVPFPQETSQMSLYPAGATLRTAGSGSARMFWSSLFPCTELVRKRRLFALLLGTAGHLKFNSSLTKAASTSTSTDIYSLSFRATRLCQVKSSFMNNHHKRSSPSLMRCRPPVSHRAVRLLPRLHLSLGINARSHISGYLLKEPCSLRSQRLRFPSL